MPTVLRPTDILVFGPFVLDPGARTLTREGASLDLEAKVWSALHHLARHPGGLVLREELLAAVWPDVVVSDDSVSQVIRKLRALLGDGTGDARWVRTVHGKGYRFDKGVRVRIPSEVARRGPTDGFFGREDLLAALAVHLAQPGVVVTLVGPGGIGKTRLTREYLARSHRSAWFADCASARTATDLASAVAQAIGVPLPEGMSAVDHLVDVLTGRPTGLLVLDNLEQVLEPARALVGALVARAGHVHLLASSRIPLELESEVVVPVGPLEAEAAADLFRSRVRATVAGDLVARLVDELEGDPLSLELAAARMAVLSAEELIERLDDRLLLLGRQRDTGRHGNLRNNLAWTWDLLDGDQQAFLMQNAGFRAGFTAEMAEAVARLPSGDWPGDVALDLAAQGLLRRARETPPRLRMAEALRLFCEALPDARSDALRQRQAAALAGECDRLVRRHQEGALEGRALARWLPDLRWALRSALPQAPDLAARLALAMHQILSQIGPYSEAHQALEAALEANPGVDMQAALVAARLWYPATDTQSAPWRQCAQTLLDRTSEPARLRLLAALAFSALREGRPDGLARRVPEALALAEALGDHEEAARILAMKANGLRMQGRYDEATAAAAEALAVPLTTRTRASVVQAKALADHRGGRLDDALAGITELDTLADHLGDKRAKLMVASFRGIHGMESGDAAMARDGFGEALRIARELGDRSYEARLIANVTASQTVAGEWEQAVGTARRGLALARGLGDSELQVLNSVNLGIAQVMAGSPQQSAATFEAVEGLDAGRHLGWLLLWHAVALAQQGDAERAAVRLQAAQQALAAVDEPAVASSLALAEALVARAAGDSKRVEALVAEVGEAPSHDLALLRSLLDRGPPE